MAYNKYQKLRLEGSNDGINWEVVEPAQYKKGEIIAEDSPDCGGSGEEIKYRWVTISGEYMCINNDKYSVIKKQIWNWGSSRWDDVQPLETTYGELIEANSTDCGYGEQWVDTDRWECASVEGMNTTTINIYDGGSCYWSYSGNRGNVNGIYYIDTMGGSVYLTGNNRTSGGFRYPFKYMVVDGVSTSSREITLDGGQDHNVSMYFFSRPAWEVTGGNDSTYIDSPKPPFYVEDGDVVNITAQSKKNDVWGFLKWMVWHNDQEWTDYFTNPLPLKVTSDCRVDLYYNDAVFDTEYTLWVGNAYSHCDVVISSRISLYKSYWKDLECMYGHNMVSQPSSAVNNALRFIAADCFRFDGTTLPYSVSLPKVIGVGSYAFYGNSDIAILSLPELMSVDDYAFANCAIPSVSFPNLQTIGSYAFASCVNLTKLSFPNLTYIAPKAFMSCTNLSVLYLLGSSVCSLSKTNLGVVQSQFYNCPSLRSIIVPASLYNEYRTTWGTYSGLIKSY